MRRKFWMGRAVVTLAVPGSRVGMGSEGVAVVEAAGAQAPKFEVDPFWPKPLPNGWVLGQTIGLAVMRRQHVDHPSAGFARGQGVLPDTQGSRLLHRGSRRARVQSGR